MDGVLRRLAARLRACPLVLSPLQASLSRLAKKGAVQEEPVAVLGRLQRATDMEVCFGRMLPPGLGLHG